MTWQQTIDEEKEISYEEGKAEKAIEAAENFLKEGDSPEKVAQTKSRVVNGHPFFII